MSKFYFSIVNQKGDVLVPTGTGKTEFYIILDAKTNGKVECGQAYALHDTAMGRPTGETIETSRRKPSWGSVVFAEQFKEDVTFQQTALIKTLKLLASTSDTRFINLPPHHVWCAVTYVEDFNVREVSTKEFKKKNLLQRMMTKKKKRKTSPEAKAKRKLWRDQVLKMEEQLGGLAEQPYVNNETVRTAFRKWAWHSQIAHFEDMKRGIGRPKPHGALGKLVDVDSVQCKAYVDPSVMNWNEVEALNHSVLFVPRSIDDVQNIVRYAKKNNKAVRASAYMHSLGELYADPGQVTIAFVLPHTESEDVIARAHFGTVYPHDPINLKDELRAINFQKIEKKAEDGIEYGLLRCGAGARVLDLLEVTVTNQLEWTLPFNTTVRESVFGALTTTLSHGAGVKSQGVADLIHQIKVVDINGDVRVFCRDKDAGIMNSVVGGLGLFGVVVEMTFKLTKMKIAKFNPYKIPIDKAIPRPTEDIDNEESMASLKRFETELNQYYNEWRWFTNCDDVWVNCFDVHEIPPGLPEEERKLLYSRSILEKQEQYCNLITANLAWLSDISVETDCTECAQLMGTIGSATSPCLQDSIEQVFAEAQPKSERNSDQKVQPKKEEPKKEEPKKEEPKNEETKSQPESNAKSPSLKSKSKSLKSKSKSTKRMDEDDGKASGSDSEEETTESSEEEAEKPAQDDGTGPKNNQGDEEESKDDESSESTETSEESSCASDLLVVPGPNEESIELPCKSPITIDKPYHEVILPVALHFRSHRLRTRLVQAELRLPDPVIGEDGKVDDSAALMMLRKMWWMGIDVTNQYKKVKLAPLTLGLAMSVSGGSKATISPQHGNNRTASISLTSTVGGVNQETWGHFCVDLWKQWNGLSREVHGKEKDGEEPRVPIKPHWAHDISPMLFVGILHLDKLYDIPLAEGELSPLKQFYNDLSQYAKEGSGSTSVDAYLKTFGNSTVRQMMAKYKGKPTKYEISK